MNLGDTVVAGIHATAATAAISGGGGGTIISLGRGFGGD